MRTLVLQLGPSADILLSLPTLKALARSTEKSVHVLVRSPHRALLAGIEGLTVFELEDKKILKACAETGDLGTSTKELCLFLESLAAYDFDEVINLTFTPLSSFLSDFISPSHALVKGYSRHSDGHLAIPDDASAYCYAQVGPDRFNRYHMQEVLAAVAQVDLQDSDLAVSTFEKRVTVAICFESLKVMGSLFAQDLSIHLSNLLKGTAFERIVPVASEDAQEIATAALLIAAEGTTVHIAGLSNTPVMGVFSNASAAFEIGPTTVGSQVVLNDNSVEVSAAFVAKAAVQMLQREPLTIPRLEKIEPRAPIAPQNLTLSDWNWRLLQALYTGADYPILEGTGLGFQRLFEMAELAEQLLSRGEISDKVTEMLAMIDPMLDEVADLDAQVAPVVAWFNTERLRMPPSSLDDTWKATHKLFADLKLVASVYIATDSDTAVANKVRDLSLKCSTAFREYDFAAVETEFSELVSGLQTMARSSTKVGDRKWSQILTELQRSLESRDLIDLADQLEHELIPHIEQLGRATETMGVIL